MIYYITLKGYNINSPVFQHGVKRQVGIFPSREGKWWVSLLLFLLSGHKRNKRSRQPKVILPLRSGPNHEQQPSQSAGYFAAAS
jgi:hypothetical protein